MIVMPAKTTALLDEIQRKPTAAHLRLDAKDDRKKLAATGRDKQVKAFKRLLKFGNMELGELAYALGYSDQSAVSRWASGVERPQWDRLADVPALEPWISVAWGDATGADVEVTVRVRRIA